jgi:hypothetical protein
MKPVVNNLKEFLEARGCWEKDFSDVEKATYKYTTCGAWITQSSDGIKIGSIVEGCDQGTSEYTLDYPFEIDLFWDSLDKVDKEAEKIWDETHGCDDCGEENPETGYTAINYQCKTCNGEGAII